MALVEIEGAQGKIAIDKREAAGAPPILFIHGDSCRASQWAPVMDLVEGKANIAAFDFRGHGDSDPAANGDYSYSGRADDIHAVIRALGWSDVLVVAHSGGAAAALEFQRRPDAPVATLLLVEPAADPASVPEEVRTHMLEQLAGPHSLDVQKQFYASIAGPREDTRAQVMDDVAATASPARLGTTKALFEWDARAAVSSLRVPASIVVARTGDTPAALYNLGADLPHAVVPTDGHWPQLDAPQLIADEVLAMCKEPA